MLHELLIHFFMLIQKVVSEHFNKIHFLLTSNIKLNESSLQYFIILLLYLPFINLRLVCEAIRNKRIQYNSHHNTAARLKL